MRAASSALLKFTSSSTRIFSDPHRSHAATADLDAEYVKALHRTHSNTDAIRYPFIAPILP